MTTWNSKTVNVPLPTLLITVFGVGMFFGIFLGVAAYERGVEKSEEKARIERASEPNDLSRFCPPPLPPST